MRQALYQPKELPADRSIPRASPVATVQMKIEADSRVAKWDRDNSSHIGGVPGTNAPVHDLATLVSRTLPRSGRAVLAVSGGLDSMALLDVAAAVRRGRGCTITVATFDHASGLHSARAA